MEEENAKELITIKRQLSSLEDTYKRSLNMVIELLYVRAGAGAREEGEHPKEVTFSPLTEITTVNFRIKKLEDELFSLLNIMVKITRGSTVADTITEWLSSFWEAVSPLSEITTIKLRIKKMNDIFSMLLDMVVEILHEHTFPSEHHYHLAALSPLCPAL